MPCPCTCYAMGLERWGLGVCAGRWWTAFALHCSSQENHLASRHLSWPAAHWVGALGSIEHAWAKSKAAAALHPPVLAAPCRGCSLLMVQCRAYGLCSLPPPCLRPPPPSERPPSHRTLRPHRSSNHGAQPTGATLCACNRSDDPGRAVLRRAR